MVNPKNIEAAKRLIEKYESLTLKSVSGQRPYYITGFGNRDTCALCRTAACDCHDCIYFASVPAIHACNKNKHGATFAALNIAASAEEVVVAFYNRAQHIRILLKDLEKGIDPFEIVIKITTKEEARALYAIFNHSKNADLFRNNKASCVRDAIREKFEHAEVTEGVQEVIANGITYKKYYLES